MRRFVVGFAACLMAAVSVGAPAAATEHAAQPGGQVVTVAGIGEAGYSGDGYRATDARISETGSVAVGPDGTLYIADHGNGRVRSVNADGIIDTVPGTRALRSPETDGPMVNGWQYSPSDQPSAVTVTGDGTLYIAGDGTVRRLGPDGRSIFIAEISGVLSYASDIAVDGAGNVYVGGSDQVIKIDPAGTITTFVGGGSLDPVEADGKPATEARLSSYDIPIAVDAEGAVYVVAPADDPATASLHRVDPDGTMHTVLGGQDPGFAGDGGPAVEARVSGRLGGVAVDSDGNVYVHDQGNRLVRMIDPEGVITSVLPTVPFDSFETAVMAVGPDGDLYIRLGARVHRLVRDSSEEEPAGAADYPSPFADDEPGTVHVVAGSGEEEIRQGVFVPDGLGRPMRIAVGPDGSRYYSDTDQHRVMKVEADGTTSVFAGTGEAEFAGDGGKATEATLWSPAGLAVGQDGSVYIADSGNERVRKVDPSGVITTVAGNGVAGDPGGTFGEDVAVHGDGGPATAATVTPSDVAIAGDGSLYIAEDDNRGVRKIAPDGTITTIAGGGDRWQDDADGHPAVEADLFEVVAIALGSDGQVYVLDNGVEFIRPAVRMIDPAGIMRTVAGNSYRDESEAGFGGDGGPAASAELNNPRDLAVGPDGVLYIADAHNARLRAVDPNGTIRTVAGTGERADSGDDGQAAAAAVNEPQAVAVGADGVVSVIGRAGDRIREIKGGTITTVATLGEQEAAPAGDQPALETDLNLESVAVDHDGGLLVQDLIGELSKVDTDGMLTQPFDQDELVAVQAVAVAPDGTRYLADNNIVYRMHGDRRGLPVAGGGPPGETDQVDADEAATLAVFGGIVDLAVSPGGRLYVSTGENVYRVDDGRVEPVYSGDETLAGIAVDAEERLYLAAFEANQVYSVTADGERTTVAGDGSSAIWDEESGEATEVPVDAASVAVDNAGNFYIGGYKGIYRVDSDGTILRVADNPEQDGGRYPIIGLAFDRHGNLYYVDKTSSQVKVLVQPGEISGPFDWEMATWIAVVVLALAAAGWYGLRWRQRKTSAVATSVADSSASGDVGRSSADNSSEGTREDGVVADEPSEGEPADQAAQASATGESAVVDEPAAGEPNEGESPERGVVGETDSAEGSVGGAADEETTPPSGG